MERPAGSTAGGARHHTHLHAADYVVIGVHVVLSVLVGLLVARRQQSSKDYLLAGKSVRWVSCSTLPLSLFFLLRPHF